MNTYAQKRFSWPRLFLWGHALSVALFYLIVWRRTRPESKKHKAQRPTQRKNALDQPTNKPFVSIIVPARNEERNIRRCVTSLLEQECASACAYEVLVVDDGSTDGTGRILKEIAASHPHGDRLRVLRLDDLPAGWAGKPHALHAGVQATKGDWLLFTDADTWHAPQALCSALERASAEQIDLFSLGSAQDLPGFWEKTLMPLAYLGIAMQYPPRQVNDPTSSIAIANGQFILIRRSVYDALGGYARPAMRSTVVDDRDLARLVKQSGFRLRFEDGRSLLRVQMYRGLRETWRGWRKNVYLGSRGGLAFVLLELIGLPQVTIVPFLLPLLALSVLLRKKPVFGLSAGEIAAAALVGLAPVLAYRACEDQEVGVPWYYALTHPLASAVFEGILAQSTWQVLTHQGVEWRGRRYYGSTGTQT
jgi:chlorobactene glucosyltransferase